ncbi:T9SS type A sorting domain-containing protein [Reichenbachiella agarivorans]|uniref:T9SS type A sorting domain-containing protein n=1 Tax=Reichenbachiella agarivorans TaxID=2979464 RepID=A0ABY6CPC7_9BACT|nr:T9SS type A sorting domain-containing protein [Reichenbachiella agarivorans]UXP32224.1 T9SS type A sorting domain-containing protein [Reichenbachiella agarivorans]
MMHLSAACPNPDGSRRFTNQNNVLGDVCSYVGNHSVRWLYTFTINGDVTINGDFAVYGTLIINGNLTVTGELNIDATGELTVNTGASLDVGQNFNNGGWFIFNQPDTNNGSITVGGDFVNEEYGHMTIEGEGGLWIEGQMIAEEGSTLDIEDGGTVVANGGYVDDGGIVTYDGEEVNLNTEMAGSPLPVEFTYFKCLESDDEQMLVWETASEINNEGFEIQRKESSDDDFYTIGFVEGNGTSNTMQQYSYAIPVSHETVMYRLKQIDFDGGFEYSAVVQTGMRASNVYSVYPNPTNGQIYLNGGDVNAFELYNLSGKAVLSETVLDSHTLEQHVSLYLMSAQSGRYMLSLYTPSGMVTINLVKE